MGYEAREWACVALGGCGPKLSIPRTDLDSPHRLENEADRESEFESTFLQARP